MPRPILGHNDALSLIKRDLESMVGRQVTLRANRGRKKIFEVEGILEQTYPKIFVVVLHDRPNSIKRLSYTYSDVLTSTVELSVEGCRIGEECFGPV